MPDEKVFEFLDCALAFRRLLLRFGTRVISTGEIRVESFSKGQTSKRQMPRGRCELSGKRQFRHSRTAVSRLILLCKLGVFLFVVSRTIFATLPKSLCAFRWTHTAQLREQMTQRRLPVCLF